MQKPRIRVRALDINCHVIFNGKNSAVIHRTDAKKDLMERVEYLKSVGCNWSADQILKCIRMA